MFSSMLMTCALVAAPPPTGLVNSTDPFGDGSLISKYQLESSGVDLCGRHNATMTAVTYGAAQFTNGGIFNGTTSTGRTGITGLTGPITVSAWAKSTTHFGDTNAIFYMSTNNKRIQIVAYSGTANAVATSTSNVRISSTLFPTSFVHIVAVLIPATNVVKIYIYKWCIIT